MKQGNQIKNMLNKKMEHLALPLFAIFLGFVIGGLVIALSGYDPFATIGGILAVYAKYCYIPVASGSVKESPSTVYTDHSKQA